MSPLDRLAAVLLRWLASELAPYIPPKRPHRPILILKREEGTMLVYGLTLPPPTAPDVVKWELSTVVNGGAETIGDVADGAEVPFNDNDQVVLKVRQVDDAGNVSEWSPELAFTASDTLAPGAPGALSVNLLREE